LKERKRRSFMEQTEYIELTIFCPGKPEHGTTIFRRPKDIRNYSPVPDQLLTKVWQKDGSSVIVTESPKEIGEKISAYISAKEQGEKHETISTETR
jgi:hypothetical protein